MNKPTTEKRVQIIGLLVEGNSLRSTNRLSGCSINTVTNFWLISVRFERNPKIKHYVALHTSVFNAMKYGVFVTPKRRISLKT